MVYRKDSITRRKRIIAPKPTKKERIPRMTGRKRYKPTNTQINPVPHTENPKVTNAIFTTNFMLIGRLLPCFLFFTILLIISDFFFMPYRWGVLTLCFGYVKGRLNPPKTNFCGINTLARRERGRFFRQTNLATGFAEIPLYPEYEVKKYPP